MERERHDVALLAELDVGMNAMKLVPVIIALAAMGCGSPQSSAVAEPTPSEDSAAAACAGGASDFAKKGAKNVKLVDARQRTAAEVVEWHETRDGRKISDSRWREVDPQASMTVCLFDGDFSESGFPQGPDAQNRDYKRLIVVIDPGGSVVPDRVGPKSVDLGTL